MVVISLSLVMVGIWLLIKGLEKRIENKVREKDTLNSEFWTPILETTDFKDYIKQTYSI